MTTQPKALRLANSLDLEWANDALDYDTALNAAAELRRLVSFNQQLMDEVARLNKAVADEREACAEVCEKIGNKLNGLGWKHGSLAEDIAYAIRARGNT